MNPTLADWLQGWGTVAGSVFSAIAAIAALALYWHEVRNRRSDVEDAVARQARGVLVTIDTPSRPTQIEKMDAIVHNFTTEVILTSLRARASSGSWDGGCVAIVGRLSAR